ncbi:putative CLASP N terminal [Blattamonas nauphoetae]|uniref:CLASP N terminal n=1 Tax=Blattamonas nauphoetae TaxID=2049346 RepID=A0ABQ9XFS1_9EUKA|nr:putative CLASP N terminal [Blattamonas nauphoetae]
MKKGTPSPIPSAYPPYKFTPHPPRVDLQSDKALKEHVTNIKSTFETISVVDPRWTDRLKQIQLLRGLSLGDMGTSSEFLDLFTNDLYHPLLEQFADGRSSYLKELCDLLSTISYLTRDLFSTAAELYFPELLKLVASTNAVMRDSAMNCILSFVKWCNPVRIIPGLCKGATQKGSSVNQRLKCSEALRMILLIVYGKQIQEEMAQQFTSMPSWNEKMSTQIEPTIINLTTDASPDVRQVGRQCVILLKKISPDRTSSIEKLIEPSTLAMINKEEDDVMVLVEKEIEHLKLGKGGNEKDMNLESSSRPTRATTAKNDVTPPWKQKSVPKQPVTPKRKEVEDPEKTKNAPTTPTTSRALRSTPKKVNTLPPTKTPVTAKKKAAAQTPIVKQKRDEPDAQNDNKEQPGKVIRVEFVEEPVGEIATNAPLSNTEPTDLTLTPPEPTEAVLTEDIEPTLEERYEKLNEEVRTVSIPPISDDRIKTICQENIITPLQSIHSAQLGNDGIPLAKHMELIKTLFISLLSTHPYPILSPSCCLHDLLDSFVTILSTNPLPIVSETILYLVDQLSYVAVPNRENVNTSIMMSNLSDYIISTLASSEPDVARQISIISFIPPLLGSLQVHLRKDHIPKFVKHLLLLQKSTDASLRIAVINCLVDLHLKIGETFMEYLTEMEAPQKRLLQVYIDRAQKHIE